MILSEASPTKTTVLVTGATGFLGAYIVKELIQKGYAVRALKRKTAALPFFIEQAILEQVEWVEGDVLDLGLLEDALTDIELVIHAAAIVSFHKRDRSRMYATNIQGTANLVNFSIELGVRRLVHVSSVAALGRTANGEEVTEEKKWTDSRLNTHYAYSKHKAEMEVWRGMAEGLEGVIVNPSTILGFGNWHNSSCALFKNSYEEFPWYTTGVNGFVHVQDAARAIVALLEHSVTMERFIISAENWSFRKLLTTIADGFNKKAPQREAGPLLSELAWRLEKIKAAFSGKQPLLSRETAKIAQSKTYFDNRKLLGVLPEFHYTPLEQAVLESCKQYLAHYSV
ncbi:NAD-dependent epimerase/dehydratase family protein [Flavihumibacter sp. CACIAM 22H1]|uniref:NAD-dependent epimerase/dehydratase family protein n=1 Tax=Flavihumibacter sp. CACIAM 22H1 TaxID=1812911 RepID=UPI0007A8D7B5|nr:NAD-dependent epimerase/dehydratase family protein [Flavihumibacter sp. CACIAM 22H1]KYP13776.1 MAG: 3-beta hydroxysteroid dehydrogenase [Flavihumibacter sp. CACIAM 22H1]